MAMLLFQVMVLDVILLCGVIYRYHLSTFYTDKEIGVAYSYVSAGTALSQVHSAYNMRTLTAVQLPRQHWTDSGTPMRSPCTARSRMYHCTARIVCSRDTPLAYPLSTTPCYMINCHCRIVCSQELRPGDDGYTANGFCCDEHMFGRVWTGDWSAFGRWSTSTGWLAWLSWLAVAFHCGGHTHDLDGFVY